MANPLMYQEDMFVVLVPGEEEVFLTPEEMLSRLEAVLVDYPDQLPRDLQKFDNLPDRARHLRDTSCEFELEPGKVMQWYVVRLEK
ncbi:chlororespiratory reduction protein 7 [filamentous cyanobacterium CCP5]|nr:chlororespiratory reduction protein 7 [filamentous cyanobacterium CCP5]